MSKYTDQSLLEKISLGFISSIVVIWLISLMVYVIMLLWNNLAPIFGINIQLTMWLVVKLWLFMMIIKWIIIK